MNLCVDCALRGDCKKVMPTCLDYVSEKDVINQNDIDNAEGEL